MCLYFAEVGLTEVTIYMETNGNLSGWYGSSLNIGDDSYTLTGYTQSISACADLSSCLTVTAGGGIMQYQIGWTIFEGDGLEGIEILSGGAPFNGELGNCDVPGCNDANACNFDPFANTDDGSCIYPDAGLDCDGNCLADADGDGVCDEFEVEGCTDQSALNFDSTATDSDDSCIYEVLGCTDATAANYDSAANTDDGSCDFGPWGQVEGTDCNMTILVPGDAAITIEGESITVGDWLGAFYLEDATGEMICGGSTIWTGETTSIAAWGAEGSDNGFQTGETLTWGTFDNETESFILGANVSYNFGAGEYSCNGLTGLGGLDAVSIIQEIPLEEGWGIWSTYIDPADTDMASVFSLIVSDLTIVKDETGSVYWPMFGLNSIGSLTKGKGYQVKMATPNTLVLEGDLVPYNYDISLDEGWGIMGYLHQDCYSAVDMMAPVVNDLVILKDEAGSVYWPMFGLNSIGNMCPGKGYQVKMSATTLFNYPASGGQRIGDIYTERPIHFDEPVNTGSNMIIGFPQYAWESTLSIGDEIAAYDEEGRLIGSTVYEGSNLALTVWGDDMTTDEKDGLIEGRE